jgi:hypothetical protein
MKKIFKIQQLGTRDLFRLQCEQGKATLQNNQEKICLMKLRKTTTGVELLLPVVRRGNELWALSADVLAYKACLEQLDQSSRVRLANSSHARVNRCIRVEKVCGVHSPS